MGFSTSAELIEEQTNQLEEGKLNMPNYHSTTWWTLTTSDKTLSNTISQQTPWAVTYELENSDNIGVVSLKQLAREVNDSMPDWFADVKDRIAANGGLNTAIHVDFIEESALVDYMIMVNKLMLEKLTSSTDAIAATPLSTTRRWLGEKCEVSADCDIPGTACNADVVLTTEEGEETGPLHKICVLEVALTRETTLCSADHQCASGYCDEYSHTCKHAIVVSSTSYVKFVLMFFFTWAIIWFLYVNWILFRNFVPEILRYLCYCWWRHADDTQEAIIRKRTFVTWLDLLICFVTLIGTSMSYLTYRAQLRPMNSMRLLLLASGFFIIPPLLWIIAKPCKRKRHMFRQGFCHLILLFGAWLLYISTPDSLVAFNDTLTGASFLPGELGYTDSNSHMTPTSHAWPNFQEYWQCCGMQSPPGVDATDYECNITHLADKPSCTPIMRKQTRFLLATIRCYAVVAAAVCLFCVGFLLFWNAEKDYTKIYASHWAIRQKQIRIVKKTLRRAEKYADMKLDVKDGRVVPASIAKDLP